MENVSEINNKIAKNLTYYRKAAGLTQAELAEKINYSDKSVSKWESGNGVPDVYILLQLAQLFSVTLNELVGDEPKAKPKKSSVGFHVSIMLLSSGIVWLVATCAFVLMQLLNPTGFAWWLTFLYAVCVNAIVMLVYASIWKYRILNFVSVSTLRTVLKAVRFFLHIPNNSLPRCFIFFRKCPFVSVLVRICP